jgi:hypothetical protein
MFKNITRATAIASCVIVGALASSNVAFSQATTIEINISKAGFVVGVTGGKGVLNHNGKSYPLSVGGMSLGLTIGVSSAQMFGEVQGLTNVSDIEGTYGRIGASAAVGVGGQNMLLENSKGVKLRLTGRQQGIEASLDAGGLTIKLK